MSNIKEDEESKPSLFVSYSGGKTSAFMCSYLLDNCRDKYNLIFGFANTSCEHEKTLEFVKKCDEYFKLNLVWLEAVIHPEKGMATTHKVIDFETAKRNGEIFESMIKKYGIPNVSYLHCTRELKARPIDSYLKSIDLGHINRAIGIRRDEPKRLVKHENRIYPVSAFDKWDVNDYWEDMPFTLEIEEHEGNCVTCWKKSIRKLFRLIDEDPTPFEFNRRMEKEYGKVGAEFHKQEKPAYDFRRFFRENLSTDELFRLKEEYYNSKFPLFHDLDENSGCSESCEAF